MKTEAEVRKHRDDLRAAMKIPCDCSGTSHAIDCAIGGRMMEVAERNLSWVLGENDDLDYVVKGMAERARSAKAGLN